MSKRKTIAIILSTFITLLITVVCFLTILTITKSQITTYNFNQLLDRSKTILWVLFTNQIVLYITYFFVFEEILPND